MPQFVPFLDSHRQCRRIADRETGQSACRCGAIWFQIVIFGYRFDGRHDTTAIRIESSRTGRRRRRHILIAQQRRSIRMGADGRRIAIDRRRNRRRRLRHVVFVRILWRRIVENIVQTVVEWRRHRSESRLRWWRRCAYYRNRSLRCFCLWNWLDVSTVAVAYGALRSVGVCARWSAAKRRK